MFSKLIIIALLMDLNNTNALDKRVFDDNCMIIFLITSGKHMSDPSSELLPHMLI